MITEKPNSIFNQTFQLQFSLTLLKEIKINWFNNDSSFFISFLDYLIECWLVFSYDDGVSFTTSRLLRNKKKVLDKFETMYLGQKEDLTKIYNLKYNDEKELLQLLKKVPKITAIKHIPLYKAYLLDLNDLESKRWSLYREVVFRILSIAFVDNRFVSYIPFVVKKIEIND